MCDAVLHLRLRSRHLVVGVQRQLALIEGEDCVGAPVHRIGGAAARLSSTAPFVGEDEFAAVVAEVRGVPEGKVRIGNRFDADGIHRIGDIKQNSVAGTCPSGQTDSGVHGNVVATPGSRGCLCSFSMRAALPKTICGSTLRVREDARAADHLGLLWVRQRHLDYDDGK